MIRKTLTSTFFSGSLVAGLVACLCPSVHAWSISGTVKSSTGNLSGVAVTVQDSSKYSTTTDANGAFTLSTPSGVSDRASGSNAFYAQRMGGNLVVQCPNDGALELSLVDGAGRSIWSANTVSSHGVATVALPNNLRSGAIFLRIRHGSGVEYQAVNLGTDGIQVTPSRAATRAMAANPVLIFKKSGYDSATYAMQSSTVTGITVTMTASDPGTVCDLPTTFKWKDFGKPIAEPKNGWLAIKDFTMVHYNNQYIVYMTYTPAAGGFLAAYMAPFSDFSKAADAAQAVMPNNLPGVAPELMYFTPKNTWVFTTQWCGGGFCYTTGSDPTKPTSFSATTQSLLSENITPNAPIDQVTICDDANCYLFYADDKGNIYRGSMAKASYPGKFSGTKKIISETDAAKLFEAVEVYKLKGQKKYLMIVECGYPRYFRGFTATDLGGSWTPIANTRDAATPFAGKSNVTGGWSNDISHGEVVRTGYDEYREIDPCNLQMIYQGIPTTSAAYDKLPYRMGLLTFQK